MSDSDYQHAQKVWELFQCQTLKDYHNIYLKTDVLLLTDLFEKFRKMSMESYGLEPVHYYSLPGLSWDAALKYTGVELELITDINMHQMVEKGIRGGISMISHRYAKANNIHTPDYDPSSPTRSLIYLDANSLYPTAMCQPLPLKDFKFVSNEIDVRTIADDAEKGYILEVDIS